MSWTFETVTVEPEFAEGPVWDGGSVLFTDIPNERILRYDPREDGCTVYRTDTGGATGLKFDHDGNLYGCEMHGQRVSRYEADGTDVPVAAAYEGHRLNSPNDLSFDEQGCLWFSDPDYEPYWMEGKNVELDHESVYRVDTPGSDGADPERVTFDTTNPNGVMVSKHQRHLYVAQTDPQHAELRSYPIEEGGQLGAFEILHDFSPHRGIDGMCMDSDGNVVATAGWEESGPGPMVYVIDPKGGVLETHPFPGEHPTNCTFGGPDNRKLYVTSGWDGGLHRARTDRSGFRASIQ